MLLTVKGGFEGPVEGQEARNPRVDRLTGKKGCIRLPPVSRPNLSTRPRHRPGSPLS